MPETDPNLRSVVQEVVGWFLSNGATAPGTAEVEARAATLADQSVTEIQAAKDAALAERDRGRSLSPHQRAAGPRDPARRLRGPCAGAPRGPRSGR